MASAFLGRLMTSEGDWGKKFLETTKVMTMQNLPGVDARKETQNQTNLTYFVWSVNNRPI